MAALALDLIYVPSYNLKTLMIFDGSIYPTNPPEVVSPTIEITPPGFNTVVIPFTVNEINTFTSLNLQVTTDNTLRPLPDGVYHMKYSVSPAFENFVEKTFLRVDLLQEKFDKAFLTLDMMQCDRAIKEQSKQELVSIYLIIQGAIAASNECANEIAMKLYRQADRMLELFFNSGCGCTGKNYI